jgi:hypothetical protein
MTFAFKLEQTDGTLAEPPTVYGVLGAKRAVARSAFGVSRPGVRS